MKNSITIMTLLFIAASLSGQPSRRVNSTNPGSRERETKLANASIDKRVATNPNVKPMNRSENRDNLSSVPNINRNSNFVNDNPGRKYSGGREIMFRYPVPPKPREYRRVNNPYRPPVHFNVFWTPEIRIEYFHLYPFIDYYKYPVGYRIENVSAYDAIRFRGEVVNVYGEVTEVYYSRHTDEYILYFGAYYPYHDFTTVIPGEIARRYSPWPERHFKNEYLIVTGLVTMFEGIPEIVVRSFNQINAY